MARELAYLTRWRNISFAYRYIWIFQENKKLYRASKPLPTSEDALLKRRGHWMLLDTPNRQMLALRETRRKLQ
jgi:hypothetical protein